MSRSHDPPLPRPSTASLTIQIGSHGFLVTFATDGRVVIDGVDQPFQVTRSGPGEYGVRLGDGPSVQVVLAEDDEVTWVFADGETYEVTASRGPGRRRIKPRIAQEDLTAPMPATVASIAVRPGDDVRTGDTLLVLEAMKMELPIRAPAEGRVRAVLCREGEQVQPGVPLVELERPDDL